MEGVSGWAPEAAQKCKLGLSGEAQETESL